MRASVVSPKAMRRAPLAEAARRTPAYHDILASALFCVSTTHRRFQDPPRPLEGFLSSQPRRVHDAFACVPIAAAIVLSWPRCRWSSPVKSVATSSAFSLTVNRSLQGGVKTSETAAL